MPDLKPGHISPTNEEEDEVQRQIADDPDDSAHWKNRTPLHPAAEVAPHIVEAYRRGRGKQKSPTKAFLTIRLDADIVEHFRQSAKGWQTSLNSVLRKAVFK